MLHSSHVTDSDEEAELAGPSTKKRKEDQLDQLTESMDAIRNDIEQIKTFTRDATTKLPLELQGAIREAFKCTICHQLPIKEPVIVAKCCKTIIGCEHCVHAWYAGQDVLTKTCPLCRAERGFTETMRLNGFDRFLEAIRNILSMENHDEHDDQHTPS